MDTRINARILWDLDRQRQGPFKPLLVVAAIVWMLYVVSGFRLPTQPITISDLDANATIRQIVFSFAGLLAIGHFYFSRSIGSVLVIRLKPVLLAGFLIVSAFWSEAPSFTIKRVAVYVFGTLALMSLVHSQNRPVNSMARIIVYFCAAAATMSLLFYVVLPSGHTVNPARPGLAGIANHPNTLAPFVSIGLMLSPAIECGSQTEVRLLRICQFALGLALLLTFSITTFFATAICLAIYLFLVSTNYRRGIMQIAIAVGALLIAVVGYSNIKGALFDITGRDETFSGRDELWRMVVLQVKQEPLIGHGFGAFWTEGKGRELVQTWNPRQSHNAYLDVLVDLGTVGLVAVLLLFPISLLLSWPRIAGEPHSPQRKAASAMLAVAFGYLTTYAFSQSYLLRFDIFPFYILVWITLLATNTDENRMEIEYQTLNEKPPTE